MRNTIQLGRYRHYKGNFYDVIGVAKHSETEEPMVIYKCLIDNDSLWVRPLKMFLETVNVEGKAVSRFARTTSET